MDGELIIPNYMGYAKVVYEYDKNGNLTSKSYYGVDGEPVLCNDGYAKVVYEYDKNGNKTSENYYDVNGKLVLIDSQEKATLTLAKGMTYTLGTSSQVTKTTWKSSSKKVVTVSKKGKLTAKATGKATITATITYIYS